MIEADDLLILFGKMELLNKIAYLRQDGKTPWSFTPVWYWDSVLHVQDRWETEKMCRQMHQSRCWDTTPAVLGF